MKFVLTTRTTLRVAATANDSDRKWPLVWKGPFVFLERFVLTTTSRKSRAADDADIDRRLPLVWKGPFFCVWSDWS